MGISVDTYVAEVAFKLEEMERANSRARAVPRARTIALAVIIVIVTSFVLHSAGNVEWKIDRVNGVSGLVCWPFVVTDESGHLHMTYYAGESLTHSVLTDDGWKHSQVVSAPVYGASPLVFDDAGNPYTCYQVQGGNASNSYDNYTLILAVGSGDAWTESVITTSSSRGTHSVALDASGHAYVAFLRAGDVVCSNNINGLWTESLLVNVTDDSRYALLGETSIAVDSSGHPHVALGYNGGYVGVYSEVGTAWNRTVLFSRDLTFDSVSIHIAQDGTKYVGYWGSPPDELGMKGVMLATNTHGIWSISQVYIDALHTTRMFKCAIAVTPTDCVKMVVLVRDDSGYHLGVWTSNTGGWRYSEVTGIGDPLWAYSLQLSICFTERGDTVVPVSSGSAEYATDSPSVLDRLVSVSLVALASYSVGLVVWIAGVKIARSISNRGKGEFGRQ